MAKTRTLEHEFPAVKMKMKNLQFLPVVSDLQFLEGRFHRAGPYPEDAGEEEAGWGEGAGSRAASPAGRAGGPQRVCQQRCKRADSDAR
jgi:hypothetical protein